MPNPFRPSPRIIAFLTGVAAFIVLAGLAFTVPVPYVSMSPGPTFDTLGKVGDSPMFTFGDDVKTYETSGQLDFTSVSVTRSETKFTLGDAFKAWLDPDTVVMPHDFIYPAGQSNSDSDASGAAQLASSQDSSRVAAMRAAGLKVREIVEILDIADDSPAAGVLKKGDRVLRVDGKRVANVQAAADAIAARKPGDSVRLQILREGKKRDLSLDTVANENDPSKARVGVIVSAAFVFPIDVENHIGDRVGGPSAGMMFALSMYDQLTPGELTGGKHIAGTGSIDANGNVGAIGGVAQKLAGAEAAGADVFLLPGANCGAFLKSRDFDMTVVKVDTLDEAIAALETLSENPKAKVPSC